MTGAAAQRGIRSSQLIFGWESRFGSLDAYTGQKAELVAYTAVAPGTVTGRNAAAITAGRSMPRWEPGADGVTRLRVEGNVTGQDQERLSYDAPWRVMALSIYVRCWPIDPPGVDFGSDQGLISLGNGTTGGGRFHLYRTVEAGLAKWRVRRQRAALSVDSVFTEPVETAYPIDLLMTLSAAGAVLVESRDALGVPRAGSPNTNILMANPAEVWSGSKLYTAPAGSGINGGNFWLEKIRVARAVQTFTSIEALR